VDTALCASPADTVLRTASSEHRSIDIGEGIGEEDLALRRVGRQEKRQQQMGLQHGGLEGEVEFEQRADRDCGPRDR
jgi:hypothetical protein